MPSALATRDVMPPPEAPMVTSEQLDLIKRTIANGATADELKLYLFDCARQGVHPLDKLIHFTVRKDKNGVRKYTPVTSIDFMRTRAADTGEYAGSDDADFHDTEPADSDGPGFLASVTVWRLVQGQRCPFTATARWSEYKPSEDFMWRKMPHTMLAKCAEALALRKGFPRQLAGLYAKEEMDQAGPPVLYTVEAPVAAPVTPAGTSVGFPSVPNGGDSGAPDPVVVPDHLPAGAVLITKLEDAPKGGKAIAFLRHSGQATSLHGMDGIAIYQTTVLAKAQQCKDAGAPVTLEIVTPPSGRPYVKDLKRHAVPPTNAELDAELARQEMARQAGEVA